MSKKLLVFSLITVVGIFSGVFIEIALYSEDKSLIFNSLKSTVEYYNTNSFKFSELFLTNLSKNILPIIFIFLSSSSKYLVPIPIKTIFFKCLTIGFTSTFLFENFSSYGFIYIALIILPQSLLEIPIYTYLSSLTFSQATYNINSYRQKKSSQYTYFKSYALGVLVLILIILIECICLNISNYIKIFI